MTPNIKFEPDRIFARNDLFEKIIKSCKATDAEFLILEEKLGLCPCNEKDITLMPDIQDNIVQVKKENKESAKIKVSEESIEIKCPKEDENKESMKIKNENTTAWSDKNEFEKILLIVNSNKFSHKNRIGKLKYKDISNLINNINNNTISEILAREKLNKLNEIKKVEIKGKRLINGQKELLTIFNMLLNATFTEDNNHNDNHNDDNDSAIESDTDDDSTNEEENEEEHHNEKDDNENDDDENDDDENRRMIKQINNYFKMIDESESFENQINLLRKMDYLDNWWLQSYDDDDDEELNLKIYELKSAYISNVVDDMPFEEIFGHTFVTLANFDLFKF